MAVAGSAWSVDVAQALTPRTSYGSVSIGLFLLGASCSVGTVRSRKGFRGLCTAEGGSRQA